MQQLLSISKKKKVCSNYCILVCNKTFFFFLFFLGKKSPLYFWENVIKYINIYIYINTHLTVASWSLRVTAIPHTLLE